MPAPTLVLPVLLLLLPHALAHSMHTVPQAMSPITCRMGGTPKDGIERCPGPCDLRGVKGHFSNFDSPSNPSAVYRRGQRITLKYQRNNHAPGGFVRLTLVPPAKIMDKSVHARNAFFYSCWGANPVQAHGPELKKDRYSFSVVGNDGELHNFPKAVYKTTFTMPPVVPDGDYVLGWVWFGGTGGHVQGNFPQKPTPYGFFGDYWSCSFVRVRGGVPLQRQYTPVFHNDMSQMNSQGCMAANDSPGVCTWEPCKVTGKYRKPRPFLNGNPRPLTPEMFGGKSPPAGGNNSPPRPPRAPQRRPSRPQRRRRGSNQRPSRTGNNRRSTQLRAFACRCLALDKRCGGRLSRSTKGYCKPSTIIWLQPKLCKETCCKLCKLRLPANRQLCSKPDIKSVCGLW